MMKKFNFNFSFLDRFKKKSEVHSVEVNDETNLTEEYEEVEEVIYEEVPEDLPEDRAQEYFSENASDPIFSNENHEDDSLNTPVKSEFDSDIDPEDFAEKSLSGYDIEKHREKLKEIQDSLTVHSEISEDFAGENDVNGEIHPEDIDTFSQENSIPFQYEASSPPSKPQQITKKKFSFPSFNSEEAREKIKAAFSKNNLANRIDKVNWNDFIVKLFSPYSRGKIHSLFVAFLVITLTYLFGKNIALFFSKTPVVAKQTRSIYVPTERVDTSSQDINKIVTTNLFNAKESDKGEVKTNTVNIENIICLDAEKPTALDIKLMSTVVLQDSVKSLAAVQVRGNSELINVREGEKLEQLAEVSKINRLKLILKNLQTGECEYAVSDEETDINIKPIQVLSREAGKKLFKSINPNIKNEGNNFKIKRNYRDAMINNMNEILTQAKAIQITNPDGSLCFKMTEVVSGSIYSQLNIQENDIVCNINGKKIENLNELMGLLGRIKEIDQFQIGLKRNGMNENLDYNFE